ncbi:phage terminase small subunit [Oceanobacillus luteolus]|uniref:phage terminase small subunit n=1 Tax=Oceanobacillus luteolus TaxID=1274358 RepID=UPI00203D2BBA|nr:phage terminase small subunit [Oceanobacillus luteolus]MCM3739223.1 phage terminase small subunit [Oceanobacillus luteolus]
MPNWEEIQKEWETSKTTLKALAEKHDVKLGTLKSRKSREKWSRDATKKDATQTERMQPKRGAPKGNKNAKGNKGNPNPENQFTERNTKALKHGLFSRYIPQETLEIMGMLDKDDPADLIWDQIQIQYAAIIRAQEIMFVTDKNEMIKELKKAKYEYHEMPDGDGGIKLEKNLIEEEFEFQFAWDRQATFLNAQSRAIAELRSSIKQFIEMASDEDERKLKLEQMQGNIDKTKAEIESLTGSGESNAVDDWVAAMGEVDE